MNLPLPAPALNAPPQRWQRLYAGLPAAINLGFAASPSFDHHPSLRAVAVLAGLFGGWLMLRTFDHRNVSFGCGFTVMGLSHLYLVGSVAAADHLTCVNVMGESISVERALWSNFVATALGVVFLVREVSRRPTAVQG